MLFPVNQGVVGPDGPGAIDVIDQRECAELFGERLDGNVDDAVLLETRHGQRPTDHDVGYFWRGLQARARRGQVYRCGGMFFCSCRRGVTGTPLSTFAASANKQQQQGQ